MVRCRLDASSDNSELRYVPATEFALWRYLMESKYARAVAVEETSVWVPERAGVWDDGIDIDQLSAVVRVCFEKPGPQGTVVPVVRYLANKTYPEARAALLAHFDPRCRWTIVETPGYFISSPASDDASEKSLEEVSLEEDAKWSWAWSPDSPAALSSR